MELQVKWASPVESSLQLSQMVVPLVATLLQQLLVQVLVLLLAVGASAFGMALGVGGGALGHALPEGPADEMLGSCLSGDTDLILLSCGLSSWSSSSRL